MRIRAWLQRTWHKGLSWAQAIEEEMHTREKSSASAGDASFPYGLHAWMHSSCNTIFPRVFNHIATLQAQGSLCAWAAHTPTAALQMQAKQQGVDPHALFVITVPGERRGGLLLRDLLAMPTVDWLFVDDLAPDIFSSASQAEIGRHLNALHRHARQQFCHLRWLHTPPLEGAPPEHVWLYKELLCYSDDVPR